jgi:hypothetical protein
VPSKHADEEVAAVFIVLDVSIWQAQALPEIQLEDLGAAATLFESPLCRAARARLSGREVQAAGGIALSPETQGESAGADLDVVGVRADEEHVDHQEDSLGGE